MNYKDQILSYIDSISQYPKELINEELGTFDMFIQTDASSKPAYVPSKLVIIKTYGNGLCWINSLLVSGFGSMWQTFDELDMWINSIKTTICMDDNFVPILGLETYGFGMHNSGLEISKTGISEYNIIDFLNANKYLMYVLSLNILKFAIQNYDNKKYNMSPKNLILETGIAFNQAKQKFYAIDGQLRNFIMSIMGIDKVIVYQNKTDTQNRRHTNVDLNLFAIDYYGEYAGFEINAFQNINVGGVWGSVLLFTHNSEHYDAFLDSDELKTCFAKSLYGETLPTFIEIS
jgi:hypothetical protein